MQNKEIREAIESAGLKYWEVAERIGIDSCNFSKWLRRELTGERRQRTLNAIEELKKEKLDIRNWNPDHSKMSRGVTLSEDEARILSKALIDVLGR